jgi:hypothetical protein
MWLEPIVRKIRPTFGHVSDACPSKKNKKSSCEIDF